MVASRSLKIMSVAALLLLGIAYGSAAGEKVSLADLPAFLAELGRLTAGRKSARAPQMKCDGGSAGCGYSVQPRAVDCVNLATTHPPKPNGGPDWHCRPVQVMSAHFKMSNIRVSCEGYRSQEDLLHILRGSCGVEYELDVAVGGNSSGYSKALYHSRSHGFPAWEWTSVGALVVTLAILVSVIYGLLSGSSASERARTQR